jgi:hypothetical protein
MSYINPSPGVAAQQLLVYLDCGQALGNLTLGGSNISLPALQNITINSSNDVFTWSQLDSTAKKSIATTATNSLSMNIVVDNATFFGSNITAAQSNSATQQGVLGLSRNKTLVTFSVRADGSSTTYIKGQGYVTGVAPAITAEQPVWVTPLNIAVTGEYTVSATA